MLGDRTGTELQGLEKPKNSCKKPEVSELYKDYKSFVPDDHEDID